MLAIHKVVIIHSPGKIAETLDLSLRGGERLLEEGRRQEAEGRRNDWMGILTPTNRRHRIDGGVLDPVGQGIRAYLETFSFLLPSALCLARRAIKFNKALKI